MSSFLKLTMVAITELRLARVSAEAMEATHMFLEKSDMVTYLR